MVQKFFPLDKNYLLERVQLQEKDALLAQLLALTKVCFLQRYNPLGLADPVSEKVRAFEPDTFARLHSFYLHLAAMYRYKYGHNQLAFLWDGTDHSEQYRKEWTAFFLQACHRFCREELFLRAVLDLTVFFQADANARLAENRMQHFLTRTFELRVLKKGLVPARVA